MSLLYCTLTGIDESTSISSLQELSEEFPFVEFGALYSLSRQGKEGRYPSLDWFDDFANQSSRSKSHPNFALHLCGRAVNDFLENNNARLNHIARVFYRIQINFKSNLFDLTLVDKTIARSLQTIITQHNPSNEGLWQHLKLHKNYGILFDESGGRGLERNSWPAPLNGIICGYAGGLGPDNLSIELPKIHRASNYQPYWIDMEGKLRDKEDRFDLTKAKQCLRIIKNFIDNNIADKEIT